MKIFNTLIHIATALIITTLLNACGSGGDNKKETAIEKSGNVLANGYLQYATVCLDTNDNKICDETGDLKTQTDENGSFTLSALASQYAQYAVIAESNSDTLDDDGDVSKRLVLSTPPGKTGPGTDNITVSPLTTMVQAYQQANLGLNADAAEDQIKTGLGIDNEAASLFDDYIKKMEELSNSGMSNKITVSGYRSSDAPESRSINEIYKLFRRVAEVTSVSIQEAITDVETNTPAGVDLNENLDALIVVVVDNVVGTLPKLVTAIDALPAGQFNPDELVTELNLKVDLNTVAEAIIAQEQINTASSSNMETVLQAGLNFFEIANFNNTYFIARSRIGFATNSSTQLASSTRIYDPFSGSSFIDSTDNSDYNSNSMYLGDAGWTPYTSDLNNGSAQLNADGSADISAPDRSFRVTAAVTDVSGQVITNFLPQDSDLSSTNTFSNNARAIRFSGENLSNSYYLETYTSVDANEDGNQDTQLSELLTSASTPFDPAVNDDPNVPDANPVGGDLGCYYNPTTNEAELCMRVEFVGNDTTGAAGTSGTSNYYLMDYINRTTTGYHTITRLDTGSWNIESIRGETILVAPFPAKVQSQLTTFSNSMQDDSTGVLYSVYNGTLYQGNYIEAGTAFAEGDWAYNDIAAYDIEQLIVAEFSSQTSGSRPDITDTTLLDANSGSFPMNLFLYDVTNDTTTPIELGAQFTRAADIPAPTAGDNYRLTLNWSTPTTGTSIEAHELTIDTVTVDALSGATVGTATEQLLDANNQPAPNSPANSASFAMLANGEMRVVVSDNIGNVSIDIRLVPVTGDSTSPSIDVIAIITTSDLQNSVVRYSEAVITGVLEPVLGGG